MKIKYKQRLFLYFFAIFAMFTTGVMIVVQSREKKNKTYAIEQKLDAYTDIINIALSKQPENTKRLDSINSLLPQNIRLTLINKQGDVLYDNTLKKIEHNENHAQRPEIVHAANDGSGTDIRISASNNQEYLYYAKRFNSYFIRVALPYNVQVQQFLKADNALLYYIIILFALMLVLINFITDRFGKSINQLRDFTFSNGDNHIEFPNDELGEIGRKITENYVELQKTARKVTLEREKLLQHIHSSEEGVCFFSSLKKVEFYNGLFIQHLNIITDEAGSEPLSVFNDPAFKNLKEFIVSNNKDKTFFETKIAKQGKFFLVRANIFEDTSFEVIIHDITEQ